MISRSISDNLQISINSKRFFWLSNLEILITLFGIFLILVFFLNLSTLTTFGIIFIFFWSIKYFLEIKFFISLVVAIILFENSIEFLGENGIYIIEDAQDKDLLKFKKYFDEKLSNYNYNIIVLKKAVNTKSNNNLIEIRKIFK